MLWYPRPDQRAQTTFEKVVNLSVGADESDVEASLGAIDAYHSQMARFDPAMAAYYGSIGAADLARARNLSTFPPEWQHANNFTVGAIPPGGGIRFEPFHRYQLMTAGAQPREGFDPVSIPEGSHVLVVEPDPGAAEMAAPLLIREMLRGGATVHQVIHYSRRDDVFDYAEVAQAAQSMTHEELAFAAEAFGVPEPTSPEARVGLVKQAIRRGEVLEAAERLSAGLRGTILPEFLDLDLMLTEVERARMVAEYERVLLAHRRAHPDVPFMVLLPYPGDPRSRYQITASLSDGVLGALARRHHVPITLLYYSAVNEGASSTFAAPNTFVHTRSDVSLRHPGARTGPTAEFMLWSKQALAHYTAELVSTKPGSALPDPATMGGAFAESFRRERIQPDRPASAPVSVATLMGDDETHQPQPAMAPALGVGLSPLAGGVFLALYLVAALYKEELSNLLARGPPWLRIVLAPLLKFVVNLSPQRRRLAAWAAGPLAKIWSRIGPVDEDPKLRLFDGYNSLSDEAAERPQPAADPMTDSGRRRRIAVGWPMWRRMVAEIWSWRWHSQAYELQRLYSTWEHRPEEEHAPAQARIAQLESELGPARVAALVLTDAAAMRRWARHILLNHPENRVAALNGALRPMIESGWLLSQVLDEVLVMLTRQDLEHVAPRDADAQHIDAVLNGWDRLYLLRSPSMDLQGFRAIPLPGREQIAALEQAEERSDEAQQRLIQASTQPVVALLTAIIQARRAAEPGLNPIVAIAGKTGEGKTTLARTLLDALRQAGVDAPDIGDGRAPMTDHFMDDRATWPQGVEPHRWRLLRHVLEAVRRGDAESVTIPIGAIIDELGGVVTYAQEMERTLDPDWDPTPHDDRARRKAELGGKALLTRDLRLGGAFVFEGQVALDERIEDLVDLRVGLLTQDDRLRYLRRIRRDWSWRGLARVLDIFAQPNRPQDARTIHNFRRHADVIWSPDEHTVYVRQEAIAAGRVPETALEATISAGSETAQESPTHHGEVESQDSGRAGDAEPRDGDGQLHHQASMSLDRNSLFYGRGLSVTVQDESGELVLTGPRQIERHFRRGPMKRIEHVELADGIEIALEMPQAQFDELDAVGWDEAQIGHLFRVGIAQRLERGELTADELIDWVVQLNGVGVFFAIVDHSPALWADHQANRDQHRRPRPQLFMSRALLQMKRDAAKADNTNHILARHAMADGHFASGGSHELAHEIKGMGEELEPMLRAVDERLVLQYAAGANLPITETVQEYHRWAEAVGLAAEVRRRMGLRLQMQLALVDPTPLPLTAKWQGVADAEQLTPDQRRDAPRIHNAEEFVTFLREMQHGTPLAELNALADTDPALFDRFIELLDRLALVWSEARIMRPIRSVNDWLRDRPASATMTDVSLFSIYEQLSSRMPSSSEDLEVFEHLLATLQEGPPEDQPPAKRLAQELYPDKMDVVQSIVERLRRFGGSERAVDAAYLCLIEPEDLPAVRRRHPELEPVWQRLDRFWRVRKFTYKPLRDSHGVIQDPDVVELQMRLIHAAAGDLDTLLLLFAQRIERLQREVSQFPLRADREEFGAKTLEVFSLLAEQQGFEDIAQQLREEWFRIDQPEMYRGTKQSVLRAAGLQVPARASDERLDALLDQTRDYLDHTAEQVATRLIEDGIGPGTFWISSRLKWLHSVYSKVVRESVAPASVSDLFGLMIIVRGRNRLDTLSKIEGLIQQLPKDLEHTAPLHGMRVIGRPDHKQFQDHLQVHIHLDHHGRRFSILLMTEDAYRLYYEGVDPHWIASGRKMPTLAKQRWFPKEATSEAHTWARAADESELYVLVKRDAETIPLALPRGATMADVMAHPRITPELRHGAFGLLDEELVHGGSRRIRTLGEAVENGMILRLEGRRPVTEGGFAHGRTRRAEVLAAAEFRASIPSPTPVLDALRVRPDRAALKRAVQLFFAPLARAWGLKDEQELWLAARRSQRGQGHPTIAQLHGHAVARGRDLVARHLPRRYDFDEAETVQRLEGLLSTFLDPPLNADNLFAQVALGMIDPEEVSRRMLAHPPDVQLQEVPEVDRHGRVTGTRLELRVTVQHERAGILRDVTRALRDAGINIRSGRSSEAQLVVLVLDRRTVNERSREALLHRLAQIPDIAGPRQQRRFLGIVGGGGARHRFSIRLPTNEVGAFYALLDALWRRHHLLSVRNFSISTDGLVSLELYELPPGVTREAVQAALEGRADNRSQPTPVVVPWALGPIEVLLKTIWDHVAPTLIPTGHAMAAWIVHNGWTLALAGVAGILVAHLLRSATAGVGLPIVRKIIRVAAATTVLLIALGLPVDASMLVEPLRHVPSHDSGSLFSWFGAGIVGLVVSSVLTHGRSVDWRSLQRALLRWSAQLGWGWPERRDIWRHMQAGSDKFEVLGRDWTLAALVGSSLAKDLRELTNQGQWDGAIQLARERRDEGVDRLGWVNIIGMLTRDRNLTAPILEEAQWLRAHRQHVVFIGMGGSILSPQLVRDIWPRPAGGPTLHTLDSTDPEALLQLQRDLTGQQEPAPEAVAKALAETQVIAVSKSGTTQETVENLAWIERLYRHRQVGLDPQEFIWVMSDPDSPMDQNARIKKNKRFLPSALGRKDPLSIQVRGMKNISHGSVGTRLFLLTYALRMEWPGEPDAPAARQDAQGRVLEMLRSIERVHARDPANAEGFLALGQFLYEQARAGRDKLVFVTSPSLQAVARWSELFEERLGKNRKGLTILASGPSNLHHLRAPAHNDRVVFHLRLEGEPDPEAERIEALRKAGYPVREMVVRSREEVPSVLYGLENAVLALAYLWDINVADAPAVEGHKDRIKEVRSHAGARDPLAQRLEEKTPYRAEGPDGVVLLYDGLMREKVLTDQGRHQLERLAREGASAARLYAEMIRLGGQPQPEPMERFDLVWFGWLNPDVRAVLDHMQAVITRMTTWPGKVSEGPQKTHFSQQNDEEGRNSGFFTIVTAREHHGPVLIGYNDNDRLLKAQTLGTLDSLIIPNEPKKETGSEAHPARRAVLLSIPNTDEASLDALRRFMDEVETELANGEPPVMQRPARRSDRVLSPRQLMLLIAAVVSSLSLGWMLTRMALHVPSTQAPLIQLAGMPMLAIRAPPLQIPTIPIDAPTMIGLVMGAVFVVAMLVFFGLWIAFDPNHPVRRFFARRVDADAQPSQPPSLATPEAIVANRPADLQEQFVYLCDYALPQLYAQSMDHILNRRYEDANDVRSVARRLIRELLQRPTVGGRTFTQLQQAAGLFDERSVRRLEAVEGFRGQNLTIPLLRAVVDGRTGDVSDEVRAAAWRLLRGDDRPPGPGGGGDDDPRPVLPDRPTPARHAFLGLAPGAATVASAPRRELFAARRRWLPALAAGIAAVAWDSVLAIKALAAHQAGHAPSQQAHDLLSLIQIPTDLSSLTVVMLLVVAGALVALASVIHAVLHRLQWRAPLAPGWRALFVATRPAAKILAQLHRTFWSVARLLPYGLPSPLLGICLRIPIVDGVIMTDWLELMLPGQWKLWITSANDDRFWGRRLVRWNARRLLGVFESIQTSPHERDLYRLARDLFEPDAYTRRDAVRALGELGNPNALDLVLQVEKSDTHEIVRREAIGAIEKLTRWPPASGPGGHLSNSRDPHDGETWGTPYQPFVGLEEMVAGLRRLWKRAVPRRVVLDTGFGPIAIGPAVMPMASEPPAHGTNLIPSSDSTRPRAVELLGEPLARALEAIVPFEQVPLTAWDASKFVQERDRPDRLREIVARLQSAREQLGAERFGAVVREVGFAKLTFLARIKAEGLLSLHGIPMKTFPDLSERLTRLAGAAMLEQWILLIFDPEIHRDATEAARRRFQALQEFDDANYAALRRLAEEPLSPDAITDALRQTERMLVSYLGMRGDPQRNGPVTPIAARFDALRGRIETALRAPALPPELIPQLRDMLALEDSPYALHRFIRDLHQRGISQMFESPRDAVGGFAGDNASQTYLRVNADGRLTRAERLFTDLTPPDARSPAIYELLDDLHDSVIIYGPRALCHTAVEHHIEIFVNLSRPERGGTVQYRLAESTAAPGNRYRARLLTDTFERFGMQVDSAEQPLPFVMARLDLDSGATGIEQLRQAARFVGGFTRSVRNLDIQLRNLGNRYGDRAMRQHILPALASHILAHGGVDLLQLVPILSPELWDGAGPFRDRYLDAIGPIAGRVAMALNLEMQRLGLPTSVNNDRELGQWVLNAAYGDPIRAALEQGVLALNRRGTPMRRSGVERFEAVDLLAELIERADERARLREMAALVAGSSSEWSFAPVGAIGGELVQEAVIPLARGPLHVVVLRGSARGTVEGAYAFVGEFPYRVEIGGLERTNVVTDADQLADWLRADGYATDIAAPLTESWDAVEQRLRAPLLDPEIITGVMPGIPVPAEPIVRGRRIGRAVFDRPGIAPADLRGQILVTPAVHAGEVSKAQSPTAIVSIGGNAGSHMAVVANEARTPWVALPGARWAIRDGERVLAIPRAAVRLDTKDAGDGSPYAIHRLIRQPDSEILIRAGSLLIVDADEKQLRIIEPSPELDEAERVTREITRVAEEASLTRLRTFAARTPNPDVLKLVLLLLFLRGRLATADDRSRAFEAMVAEKTPEASGQLRRYAASLDVAARQELLADVRTLRQNLEASGTVREWLGLMSGLAERLDRGAIEASADPAGQEIVTTELQGIARALAAKLDAVLVDVTREFEGFARSVAIRDAARTVRLVERYEELGLLFDVLAGLEDAGRLDIPQLGTLHDRYTRLAPAARASRQRVEAIADREQRRLAGSFVVLLDEVSGAPVAPLIGGKMGNVAELYRRQEELGIHVKPGMIVTTHGFEAYLTANPGLREEIVHILSQPLPIREQARAIRRRMMQGDLPTELLTDIELGFDLLMAEAELPADAGRVSVRSSAPFEDSAKASYAGTAKTSLYVDRRNLVRRYKEGLAAVFSEAAIAYRASMGADPLDVSQAIGSQPMVMNARASGVALSIHLGADRHDELVINAAWGDGEGIVSGRVDADRIVVNKRTGARDIAIGEKRTKFISDPRRPQSLEVPVESQDRRRLSLTSEQIRELTAITLRLEAFYGWPVQVEFTIDQQDVIWIFQVRPITGIAQSSHANGSSQSASRAETTDEAAEPRARP